MAALETVETEGAGCCSPSAQETGRHLAPAGVVDADEENLGHFLDDCAVCLSERA